jgi:rhodanese-related sulfurtransferase
MGNSISIKKINFEDMQNAINDMNTLIINTLNVELQKCLIERTTTIDQESRIVNTILKVNREITIVIYGMNASDETIVNKYNQLINLGFTNVYIYPGGLFEWLLLQDIYGADIFKTTSKELDILKYKGARIIGKQLMLR